MDSSKIKAISIVIFALFAALYLGITAATAQFETAAWMIGGITLFICFALGRKIWLLIPFMASLGLSLRLPGNPSSLLLGQALVLGFGSMLFLMRKLPYRFVITELEAWGLILTLCIAQAYMRNPVGVNIFGGDTVGGKGYFLFAIALTCTLLLSGLRVSAGELKWVLRLSILGGLLNMMVSVLGNFVPAIGYYTGASYARADDTAVDNVVVDEKAATRVGFLLGMGNNLSLWISAYISPIRACIKPFWAILVLVAVVAATFSGFRNGIITVGMTFMVGIAYRSGFGGVVLAIFSGICGVALLAVVNNMHPLPPNIQRSLTFLPGTWEQRYKDDAEGSSDWRYEIWREALTSERWIRHKWLGDGLGFSATELAAQMNDRLGARAGISGMDSHRETILANGDYHSGPVSTIRVIGYVGFAVFLLAQIRLAVHAHRQILRCRGTEWFPLALLIGIPLILAPLIFVFIFGDFKMSSGTFLLSLGMVRLLENNLPLPKYSLARRQQFILQKVADTGR